MASICYDTKSLKIRDAKAAQPGRFGLGVIIGLYSKLLAGSVIMQKLNWARGLAFAFLTAGTALRASPRRSLCWAAYNRTAGFLKRKTHIEKENTIEIICSLFLI